MRWWRERWPLLALALVAYVPTFWSAPGQVGADTKTYLYLDPSRLLSRAPYMWDRHVGFGTVTHQTIGYLWPMGPWYWVADQAGLPDWVAQRLWLGTLIFAAGAGVLFLLRTLPSTDWALSTRFVAALAYALSPYLLDYSARISVILLPWAALPWLIGIVIRAARQGGWRWPAVFALVVATVGGVNATALVFAGIGPLVWLAYAIWIERSVPLLRGVIAAAKIGVLTLGVSLWWIAGLWAQGRYGIPILSYTETYETVAATASAPEVLRGLGYWFFYGSDKLGPWTEAGPMYTSPVLVVIGYGLVAAALLAAVLARWAHRRAAIALVVVGLVVAVGAHPYDSPTVYGRVFKAFSSATAGAALRSTPRTVPVVVLGLALLLAAGVEALSRRWSVAVPAGARRRAWIPALAATVLVCANQPPLFVGRLYGGNLQRDEAIPAYWEDAATAMSAGDPSTRMLELPGADFASYRWGNTVDPITPGLTDRDVVARELIPYGSAPSTDLLNAFDRRLQEGIYEPSALGPIAHLTSIGTVVLRSDLQYERYRTPRPRRTWAELLASAGLGTPEPFGDPAPNRAIEELPLIDEAELAVEPGSADPPPVALFPVVDVPAELHTAATGGALLYAGDGDGLVDAAAAGLLDDHPTVLASAGLADQSGVLDATLAADPPSMLLVTDTNRRAGRRWSTVRDTMGYTETSGEQPLVDDPTDNRLDVYPAAGDDDRYRTVAELDGDGIANVQATAYGNPVSYTPEDRPAKAFDGDPRTAWRVGAFADVRGERIVVEFETPVTTNEVTLLQPVGAQNRWLTEVELRTDGGDPLSVALNDASRAEPGQRIDLGGQRTFTELEIEVVATNQGERPSYEGLSGVGIAELDVAGRRVDEVLRMPGDLLATVGEAAADHPLVIMATRWRADPSEVVRSDPELSIARRFSLPTAREFTVSGTARVSAAAPVGPVVDVLGPPASAAAGVVSVLAADTNQSLPGDLRSGPAASVDGDIGSASTTPFGGAVGTTWTVTLSEPATVDHLDLVVVDDGRHSWPTELRVSAEGASPGIVSVPAHTGEPTSVTAPGTPAERAGEQAVRTVRVELPAPVTSASFTFEITATEPVSVNDYYGESPIATPVGIAEWGLPGVAPAPVANDALLPADCRDDLLTIDDEPFAVRIVGTVGDGLDRLPLPVEACGPAVELGPGEHEVRTARGRDTGIDIDRLLLSSGAAESGAAESTAAESTAARPTITVDDVGPVSYDATASDLDGAPFWIVLGQSHNDGWQLKVNGEDQGAPVLVDGYANGWLITPPVDARAIDIDLDWAPQRVVSLALRLSVAGVVACLVLIVWPFSRWSPPVANAASPRRTRRRAPTWFVALATSVGFGLVAGPFTGVGAGAAVALLRTRPASRRWLVWVPPMLVITTAVWVVSLDVRYRLKADFEWPTYFGAAHQLGWLAVAVVAALVFVMPANSTAKLDSTAKSQG